LGRRLKTTQHARRLALAAAPLFAFALASPKAFGQESIYAQQSQAMANTRQVLNTQLAQRPGDTISAPRTDNSPQQFDLTPVKLPERGTAFGSMQNLR